MVRIRRKISSEQKMGSFETLVFAMILNEDEVRKEVFADTTEESKS
jgi:hypothetical protein